MTFEILSHGGIKGIPFGISPQRVRSVIGAPSEVFFRGASEGIPADYFPSVGVFAYYSNLAELEALEFTTVASVVLDGVNLFKLNFSQSCQLLTSLDPDFVVDVDGGSAPNLGVGIYVPEGCENSAAPLEGVIVFLRGYYD